MTVERLIAPERALPSHAVQEPAVLTSKARVVRGGGFNGGDTGHKNYGQTIAHLFERPGYDTLAISNNGRYDAFSSDQSLVAADTDGAYDVYRYDVQTGNTILVSVDQGVHAANGNVFSIAMDGSGDVIAFDSNESDVVANDTNGLTDVFVRGISAAATTRVSVRSNGDQANGLNFLLDVSDDGLHTLFSSQATNLDSNVADTNGKMVCTATAWAPATRDVPRSRPMATSSPRMPRPVPCPAMAHWSGSLFPPRVTRPPSCGARTWPATTCSS